MEEIVLSYVQRRHRRACQWTLKILLFQEEVWLSSTSLIEHHICIRQNQTEHKCQFIGCFNRHSKAGPSWLPSTLVPANIWALPSPSILEILACAWSIKIIFLEEIVVFARFIVKEGNTVYCFQPHCRTLPIKHETDKWVNECHYWHGQHVPHGQVSQIRCSLKDLYFCKCTYHVSKIAGSKVILRITYKLNLMNNWMENNANN